MLEYYNPLTAISIELVLLSGGTTVTGRTPYVQIRERTNNTYFDFSSRTFTNTTVSSTAPLTSAIDGLYRTSWDTSGIFPATTINFLTFEYHDATALTMDDVVFTLAPLSTANVSLAVGGGGGTTIHGIWTAKQKKKLFDDIKKVREDIKSFRIDTLTALRKLLAKKTLQKEDLQVITQLKERDLKMYQELLKILDLQSTTEEKVVFEKLEEYIRSEETAKKEVLKRLDERLGNVEPNKPGDIVLDTEEDEDDE